MEKGITAPELAALAEAARQRPSDGERRYREGYTDGYEEALLTLAELFARGVSRVSAVEQAQTHHDGALRAWEDEPRASREPLGMKWAPRLVEWRF